MFFGITIGIIIGPSVGIIDQDLSFMIGEWASIPGIFFLKIIQIVVIPLIFTSIIIGITGVKNPQQLKKRGLILLSYFVFTTIIAVIIAIFLAQIIQPGSYLDKEDFNLENSTNNEINSATIPSFSEIPSLIESFFPTNIIDSMLHGELLSIVFFAIIFGIALVTMKKKRSRPLISVLNSIQIVSMTIVKIAMLLVPIAVFGMMLKVSSQIGVSALIGLSSYVLTVLLGLFILLVMYLIIVYLFAGIGPIDYLEKIRSAQLLAFSTSSSAAVMPLTMKISEEKLNVKSSVSQFVVPTGAVINMNGTALYQVIAILFLSQLFGVSLGITSLIILALSVIGASIGTPSVLGAGIAILVTIMTGLGIPASGVIIILGVDRILDMSRTVVNVTGDLTACVFLDKVSKDN